MNPDVLLGLWVGCVLTLLLIALLLSLGALAAGRVLSAWIWKALT